MIPPTAVAAKVVPNERLTAKPIAGAKSVFTVAARITEKIFQNIFISKNFVLLPSQNATLAQLVEQRIRNA